MTWYDGKVEITTEDKYADMLREVYRHADEHSAHPSTHTAASLVDLEGKVVVMVSNGFPPGHETVPGWDQKPLRDQISNHAETTAVYAAARNGIKTEGTMMVMPWLPCFPCSNAIIYSGVKTLLCHKQMVDRTPADWAGELELAVDLLHKNGIDVLMYDGKVGDCEGFMREKRWEP